MSGLLLIARRLTASLSLLVFFAISEPAWCQSVSLSSLLDEMIDRTSIVTTPNYVCRQASSYDRAAKSPEDNWFANNDTSQFIREETNGDRKEWVLMEEEGPGAITRWWITAPHYKNNFYIYIDGASKPTFKGRIDEIVGGTFLAGAPLSEENSRGRNLYLPIPYAKSVKVTCDRMEEQQNLYYQINYRTYCDDVVVESLTSEILDNQKDKITFVNSILRDPEKTIAGTSENREIQGFARHIDAEQLEGLYEAHSVYGPGEITEIDVTLIAADVVQASRSVVLSISFDGEETVWAPIGEFFGSGVGINPYVSWYSKVSKDGVMKAFWRMPFKKEAKVSFINYGDQDVDIDYRVFYEKTPWTDDTMYFHANWRQERGIQTLGGAGTEDWNYVSILGKGVYVGDVLSVVNPVEAWWGEGDEKIYVDGETFPSHFGTGTEDYYGYAWCTPLFFESPFHAQPRCEGPGNFGSTTNLRFRVLDGVPFEKSLKFDMEIWHWSDVVVDYAVTTFWYGLPGARLGVSGPCREELEEEAREPVRYNHQLSLRLSTCELSDKTTQGSVTIQKMNGFEKNGNVWRDSRQIWWRDGKIGDSVSFKVPNVPIGKRTIVLGATCAVDYGVAQFFWNGEAIGEPIDFFNADSVVHRTVKLPVNETTDENGVLMMKLVGKNANSSGEMLGIDFVEWE